MEVELDIPVNPGLNQMSRLETLADTDRSNRNYLPGIRSNTQPLPSKGLATLTRTVARGLRGGLQDVRLRKGLTTERPCHETDADKISRR